MSHLLQLREAFARLKREHHFYAKGPVCNWAHEARDEVEEILANAEKEGHPYAGFVYYSGRMADAFDREGNLVKELLLPHSGGEKGSALLTETLQQVGLHPVFGGVRMLCLGPFHEFQARLRAAPGHLLTYINPPVVSEQFEVGIHEGDPSTTYYLHPVANFPNGVYATNLEMLCLQIEQEYPQFRHWLAHFVPKPA